MLHFHFKVQWICVNCCVCRQPINCLFNIYPSLLRSWKATMYGQVIKRADEYKVTIINLIHSSKRSSQSICIYHQIRRMHCKQLLTQIMCASNLWQELRVQSSNRVTIQHFILSWKICSHVSNNLTPLTKEKICIYSLSNKKSLKFVHHY